MTNKEKIDAAISIVGGITGFSPNDLMSSKRTIGIVRAKAIAAKQCVGIARIDISAAAKFMNVTPQTIRNLMRLYDKLFMSDNAFISMAIDCAAAIKKITQN